MRYLTSMTHPRSRFAVWGLVLAMSWPSLAGAHSTEDVPSLATAWTLSPWLLVPLAAFVLFYACGLARLWRRAGWGRGLGGGQLLAFVTGIAALLLATVWPLDALGEWSMAAHMAQHALLLAVVPPLLLASQPGAALASLVPTRASKWFHRQVRTPLQGVLFALAPATVVHCAVMWGWHLPAAIAAALAGETLHWLMHASFLLAGLWFWSAVLHRLRDPAGGVGAGLLALVVVMMQMGLMGALLTFAGRPLYAHYALQAPRLGLDPLADQQLAGLLMWVPACLPYLLAGVWLLWQGLRRDDARHRGSRGPSG